jgi:hypothetical protein
VDGGGGECYSETLAERTCFRLFFFREGPIMRRTARLGGLALGLSLLAGGVFAAELKVGDMAPDFALKGSDGQTYKLSDFRGKSAVVLAWFPKAFTGG